MRARADQRGSATVILVSMIGVVVMIGAALGVVAALIVDQRKAQAAADLAALAAAAHGCASGSEVARANGARLTVCMAAGREAEVSVVVIGPRWWGLDADLTARARAGPAR